MNIISVLVVSKVTSKVSKLVTTSWDRVASSITGKLIGEARLPLAVHLGDGKLLHYTPAILRKYPLVAMTSGDNIEGTPGVEPLKTVWRLTLASLRQLP